VRTLSATLEAEQQAASKIPYLNIVVGAYTFGTDRVISFTHTEEPFQERLSIILDNSDDYLTDKNLRGAKVVEGLGFVTSSGNEYSDKSPLHVIVQSFSSSEGRLTCELQCAGVMSELAQDRARKAYKSGVDWESPTGNEGTDWTGPDLAWDDNVGSCALSGDAESELILTQSASDCRKIRFMKDNVAKVIQVWVFKNDAWFIVFEGARLDEWQEIEFDEGSVTKAKILFPDDATQKLYEFDFGNKSSLTLKDLLTGVLDGTFESYDDCTGYTLSYDSEDDIIDDITPGRDFRIPVNGSRVESAKRLLDYTYCVMRAEDDEKIHIFQPTISGAVYDYEYALDSHVFLAKRQSNTIVIPNYIIVRSPEDADEDDTYSGYAVDQPSIDAYKEVRYYYVMHGLESDEIAEDIAGAILSKFQMHSAEAGAVVPVNVGAEIYDYVKITDAREGTSVTGNIGYIETKYGKTKEGVGYLNQTFGLGGWLSSFKPEISGLPGEGIKYYDELLVDILHLNPITLDEVIDGTEYKRVLSGHLNAEGLWLLDKIDDDDSDYKRVLATQVSAGKIKISAATEFDVNYDPTTKWDGSDLDDLPDGAIHAKVKKTSISDGKILLSEATQATLYRTCTDGEKTTWNAKPDDMDDIGEGVTYQRVLATHLNSGKIKVSSITEFDGEWYSEGSVTIDATSGIYGTNNGGVTWELKNSDGKAYLADGAIVVDKVAMRIYGGSLILYDDDGNNGGTIYVNGSGNLSLGLGSWNDVEIDGGIFSGGIQPSTNLGGSVGTTGKRFAGIYSSTLNPSSYMDNASRNSYPATVEGRQIYHTGAVRIRGYVNGAWRNMTT